MMAVDTWMQFMQRRGIASTVRHPCNVDDFLQRLTTANDRMWQDEIRPRGYQAARSYGDAESNMGRVKRLAKFRREADEKNKVSKEFAQRMRTTPWPDGIFYRCGTLGTTPAYNTQIAWQRKQNN